MSLYVIGKLKPDKRMIAYKIYDSETKESKLIATKDTMRAMKNGTEILGLRFRINTDGSDILYLNNNVPNINSLSSVDSNGYMLNDDNTYILLGIKGFEENRVFYVINANCQKFEFNISEIKDKNIIGLSQSDSGISIHTKYRKQLY